MASRVRRLCNLRSTPSPESSSSSCFHKLESRGMNYLLNGTQCNTNCDPSSQPGSNQPTKSTVSPTSSNVSGLTDMEMQYGIVNCLITPTFSQDKLTPVHEFVQTQAPVPDSQDIVSSQELISDANNVITINQHSAFVKKVKRSTECVPETQSYASSEGSNVVDCSYSGGNDPVQSLFPGRHTINPSGKRSDRITRLGSSASQTKDSAPMSPTLSVVSGKTRSISMERNIRKSRDCVKEGKRPNEPSADTKKKRDGNDRLTIFKGKGMEQVVKINTDYCKSAAFVNSLASVEKESRKNLIIESPLDLYSSGCESFEVTSTKQTAGKHSAEKRSTKKPTAGKHTTGKQLNGRNNTAGNLKESSKHSDKLSLKKTSTVDSKEYEETSRKSNLTIQPSIITLVTGNGIEQPIKSKPAVTYTSDQPNKRKPEKSDRSIRVDQCNKPKTLADNGMKWSNKEQQKDNMSSFDKGKSQMNTCMNQFNISPVPIGELNEYKSEQSKILVTFNERNVESASTVVKYSKKHQRINSLNTSRGEKKLRRSGGESNKDDADNNVVLQKDQQDYKLGLSATPKLKLMKCDELPSKQTPRVTDEASRSHSKGHSINEKLLPKNVVQKNANEKFGKSHIDKLISNIKLTDSMPREIVKVDESRLKIGKHTLPIPVRKSPRQLIQVILKTGSSKNNNKKPLAVPSNNSLTPRRSVSKSRAMSNNQSSERPNVKNLGSLPDLVNRTETEMSGGFQTVGASTEKKRLRQSHSQMYLGSPEEQAVEEMFSENMEIVPSASNVDLQTKLNCKPRRVEKQGPSKHGKHTNDNESQDVGGRAQEHNKNNKSCCDDTEPGELVSRSGERFKVQKDERKVLQVQRKCGNRIEQSNKSERRTQGVAKHAGDKQNRQKKQEVADHKKIRDEESRRSRGEKRNTFEQNKKSEIMKEDISDHKKTRDEQKSENKKAVADSNEIHDEQRNKNERRTRTEQSNKGETIEQRDADHRKTFVEQTSINKQGAADIKVIQNKQRSVHQREKRTLKPMIETQLKKLATDSTAKLMYHSKNTMLEQTEHEVPVEDLPKKTKDIIGKNQKSSNYMPNRIQEVEQPLVLLNDISTKRHESVLRGEVTEYLRQTGFNLLDKCTDPSEINAELSLLNADSDDMRLAADEQILPVKVSKQAQILKTNLRSISNTRADKQINKRDCFIGSATSVGNKVKFDSERQSPGVVECDKHEISKTSTQGEQNGVKKVPDNLSRSKQTKLNLARKLSIALNESMESEKMPELNVSQKLIAKMITDETQSLESVAQSLESKARSLECEARPLECEARPLECEARSLEREERPLECAAQRCVDLFEFSSDDEYGRVSTFVRKPLVRNKTSGRTSPVLTSVARRMSRGDAWLEDYHFMAEKQSKKHSMNKQEVGENFDSEKVEHKTANRLKSVISSKMIKKSGKPIASNQSGMRIGNRKHVMKYFAQKKELKDELVRKSINRNVLKERIVKASDVKLNGDESSAVKKVALNVEDSGWGRSIRTSSEAESSGENVSDEPDKNDELQYSVDVSNTGGRDSGAFSDGDAAVHSLSLQRSLATRLNQGQGYVTSTPSVDESMVRIHGGRKKGGLKDRIFDSRCIEPSPVHCLLNSALELDGEMMPPPAVRAYHKVTVDTMQDLNDLSVTKDPEAKTNFCALEKKSTLNIASTKSTKEEEEARTKKRGLKRGLETGTSRDDERENKPMTKKQKKLQAAGLVAMNPSKEEAFRFTDQEEEEEDDENVLFKDLSAPEPSRGSHGKNKKGSGEKKKASVKQSKISRYQGGQKQTADQQKKHPNTKPRSKSANQKLSPSVIEPAYMRIQRKLQDEIDDAANFELVLN